MEKLDMLVLFVLVASVFMLGMAHRSTQALLNKPSRITETDDEYFY